MEEIVFDFEFVLTHYNYWMFVVLMMTGLYITVSRGNLVKKVVGLNIFQTSVFLLYISMGKIVGGTAPISSPASLDTVYSNPLPHVPYPHRYRRRHRNDSTGAGARRAYSRNLRNGRGG